MREDGKVEMSKEQHTFNSIDLVPVQAIIPTSHKGEGAMLVMRDATFRLLIQSGAVNFDMKNTGERMGLIAAFGELLDSLKPETPIEIVQRTKVLDPSAYSQQFLSHIQDQQIPQHIRYLAAAHVEHFQQLIQDQKLLARELYVVLTSRGAIAPVSDNLKEQIPFAHLWRSFGQAAGERKKWREPTSEEITAARHDLTLRAEEMEQRLKQIGVWTKRLDEIELDTLIKELYNARRAERKGLYQRSRPQNQLFPRKEQTRHIPRELEPPRF